MEIEFGFYVPATYEVSTRDINSKEAMHQIELKIKTMGDLSHIGGLYYEIAHDLFPVVEARVLKYDQLTSDEQDDLGVKKWCYHFPYGDNYRNYWGAILDYLCSFNKQFLTINNLQKADAKYYEFYNPLKKPNHSRPMLTRKAVNSFNPLFSIKSKVDLMQYRPLLFYKERIENKFFFPPFFLGCMSTIVISYKK